MVSILTFVALPVLFFMATWVVVTALRIWRPEQPIPIEQDPAYLQRQARQHGAPVPVGARDIREDQQFLLRKQAAREEYHFAPGDVGTIPEAWLTDVQRRRN